MIMTRHKTHIKDIVKIAGDLFRINGYGNTSMEDIAEKCNLSKASIYHHISSKQELVIECVKDKYEFAKLYFFDPAYQEGASKKDRFITLIEKLRIFLKEEERSLIGSLSYEMRNHNKEFSELIKNYFSQWTDIFTYLFESSHIPHIARNLAKDAVLLIEGAIILRAVYQDDMLFDYACDRLLTFMP